MASTDRPTTVVVERPTISDIPELVSIWWDAFGAEAMQRIFPQTPDGRRFIERSFAKFLGPAPGPDELKTECLIVRSPDTGTRLTLIISLLRLPLLIIVFLTFSRCPRFYGYIPRRSGGLQRGEAELACEMASF